MSQVHLQLVVLCGPQMLCAVLLFAQLSLGLVELYPPALSVCQDYSNLVFSYS